MSIFSDPLTRQKLEGKARLVRRISRPDADGLSRWRVEFVGDDPGHTVERSILETYPDYGGLGFMRPEPAPLPPKLVRALTIPQNPHKGKGRLGR